VLYPEMAQIQKSGLFDEGGECRLRLQNSVALLRH